MWLVAAGDLDGRGDAGNVVVSSRGGELGGLFLGGRLLGLERNGVGFAAERGKLRFDFVPFLFQGVDFVRVFVLKSACASSNVLPCAKYMAPASPNASRYFWPGAESWPAATGATTSVAGAGVSATTAGAAGVSTAAGLMSFSSTAGVAAAGAAAGFVVAGMGGRSLVR